MPGKKLDSKIVTKINQANPLELIIIAYKAAIDLLQNAKNLLKSKKNKEANENIIKAKKIISELKKALDMDIEEVSSNLADLYSSMENLLDLALKNKNTVVIEQVIRMLTEVKEAWQTIAKQNIKISK